MTCRSQRGDVVWTENSIADVPLVDVLINIGTKLTQNKTFDSQDLQAVNSIY